MGKYLKLCVLALICSMAFGCAQKGSYQSDPYSTQAQQRFRRSYEAAFDNNEQQGNQQLLRKARSAIGTPYVPGGMSPGGFDCSGFVCWAYKSVGVNLPRTAREQSVVGKRINNVEDMQVGDIVAFRHPRRGYHTGIYVGDGKFIHSPHRRTTVRINSLDDPYFKGTFLGARRIKTDGSENLVAEAESRLNDYAEEKAVRDIYRSRKPSHNVAANDDHGKKNSKDKDKNNSKDKDRSKSRDKFVEVASLDKKNSASRKPEVEKAGKSDKSSAQSSGQSSSKSSSKSPAKEDKQDKKNSASSSKQEAAKSEHKSESRKSESAKSDTRKSESHKSEAAKSDSKSGSSKPSASKSESPKGESAKKDKSDSDKVAAKSDNGKTKKAPEKKRDSNS